jgi:predicted DNA-binding transcriptional regulator AlpA
MDNAIDFIRTRKETAQRLRVSLRTLQRMEARGEAPPRIKISDRIFGYRESAIDAFLRLRTTEQRTAGM